jgi:metal-sulfur cluster biosynthetic enzyme
MARLTENDSDRVIRLLKKCIDPELGIDIVSLGLIYDVTVSAGDIHLTMTLTSPSCPYAPYFEQQIAHLIKRGFPGYRLHQRVTFEPAWSPERIDDHIKKLLFS